jgi:hypothetical protein
LWLADLLHYTIGASFLLIGKSLFGTTCLAGGFLDTKKEITAPRQKCGYFFNPLLG